MALYSIEIQWLKAAVVVTGTLTDVLLKTWQWLKTFLPEMCSSDWILNCVYAAVPQLQSIHAASRYPHTYLAEKRLSTDFCDWSEVTDGLLWETWGEREKQSWAFIVTYIVLSISKKARKTNCNCHSGKQVGFICSVLFVSNTVVLNMGGRSLFRATELWRQEDKWVLVELFGFIYAD